MSNFYNKNLYKILGVTSDATNTEIKVAYRTLVKKLHPDVNSDPKDVERFKQLKDVYEILIDPEKRKKYDILYSYYVTKNINKQEKPQKEENIKPETNTEKNESFETKQEENISDNKPQSEDKE